MIKLDSKYKKWEILGLFFVLGIAAILLLRQIGNSSIVIGDSAHHLMDGVFVLDFLKDMPVFNIYDYTVSYYTQYPALAIGYRPPFFPFIEAIFNAIFGVQVWSSRLAILAFFLAGVVAWFKLIERVLDYRIAFWTSLLLVTTPFVVQWGWYTMGELPVFSMAMITAYAFYRYTESQRPRHIYVAALLFSITVWTKQTAIFLALWFFLYLLFKGDIWDYLKRKEVWIAVLISTILITPLALITIWLGNLNIRQSVGSGADMNPFYRLSIDNLLFYWHILATDQLTPPVLVASVIGIVWSALKRDRKTLFFALGIVSTYLFFTYLIAKSHRYTIFWIAPFSLFAVVPLFYLRRFAGLRFFGPLIMGLLIVYQLFLVYSNTPFYAVGYREAADYILRKSKSPTVFFDGADREAFFVYFMRALDPKRSMYVFRGRKTLSSSVFLTGYGQVSHAGSRQDILDIFDRYGVEYIVAEKHAHPKAAKIHHILREFLEDGPFELVKEIPVLSNHPAMEGQTLRIYRYLNPKPITADYIEIRLPVVGQTIRASMRNLRTHQNDQ